MTIGAIYKDWISAIVTVAFGLLWIALTYHLVILDDSPFREYALIKQAVIADGFIVEVSETPEDNGDGSTIWFNDATYIYRTKSGNKYYGTASGDGRLNAQFSNFTKPHPIKVEYLSKEPTVSRIKGSGCQTMGEWIWRKMLLGSLLMIMLASPGFLLVRNGINTLRSYFLSRSTAKT